MRVISGQERKIREHLLLEINRSNMDHIITNILVPTEKFIPLKTVKKRLKKRPCLRDIFTWRLIRKE
jgi:transcriptional antiterminator NusG